ncbi:hypothetical protein HJFPF1_12689 [Paramyrothecium foliicola]|nr:hypothetical protein HJFPF1_12689 [Paramyrothecium foliicola]
MDSLVGQPFEDEDSLLELLQELQLTSTVIGRPPLAQQGYDIHEGDFAGKVAAHLVRKVSEELSSRWDNLCCDALVLAPMVVKETTSATFQ